MINVKATQQETERPARARYLFTDAEKYSRLPLVIVLVLGSLVAYLKTALSSGSNAAPIEPDDPWRPDELDARPPAFHPVLGDGSEEHVADAGQEDGAAPSKRPMSKSSAVLYPIFSFAIDESPPIDFSTVKPTLPVGLPSMFNYQPGNDNFPTSRAQSASSPSSGGDTPEESVSAPEAQAPARRNRAPTSSGPVKLNDVFAGQAMMIVLADLLLNTTDADGDEMTVLGVTASLGNVRIDGDAWNYQPGLSARGEVTLTYYVTDGQAVVVQHATFVVSRDPLILGTPNDDLLLGTLEDDEIDAMAGNDIIDARDGDDVISGGDGDDHIVAGAGNDTVFAGKGNDIVFGGEGNDIVFGGEGNDRLFGEAGDDLIDGEDGDDFIDGGDGEDILLGGAGADELYGGAGNDLLRGGDGDDLLLGGDGDDRHFGETGDDRVEGGAGNDLIDGGAGDDHLYGGAGDDYILGGDGNDVIDAGVGADVVDAGDGDDFVTVSIDIDEDAYHGGRGRDHLDLSLTTLGVEIDLKKGRIEGLEVGRDTISGFESVSGGKGNDIFYVDGNVATVLRGGDGDDRFVFSAPSGAAQVDKIVNEILDLMVGDRILVSSFELTEEREEDLEDRFERAYKGRDEVDNPYPLRISYERYGDTEHTIIEVDFDGNHEYELSIDVAGTYRPFVYETA
jgi:Ca2+-binding RTX toxin-like protein